MGSPLPPRVVGEGLGGRCIGEQNVRKLIDIVEGAKDGKMPTHDECYWAMLALSHLHYFEVSDIRTLTKSEDSARVRMTTEEGFRRREMATNKTHALLR